MIFGLEFPPISHVVEWPTIFGDDYPTPDGTCVRDYVHVEDLVEAHVLAAERVAPGRSEAFNVGIGKGYSVREILDSVRRVSGRDFKVVEAGRRPGDAIALYNNPARIERELGWKAQVTDIDEIVGTANMKFIPQPTPAPTATSITPPPIP